MNSFSLFASLRRSLFLPLGLSLRQAAHEWASALCQCFALSAVVLPILLLVGLKNGIIESEWTRLMNDPDALLLSPRLIGQKYDVTWEELQDINRIKGVHVALPQLSLSHSQVFLDRKDELPDSSTSRQLQITLTRADDKLLTYHNCPVPAFEEGSAVQQAVLNDIARQTLKAKVGDEFILRPLSSNSSRAPLNLRVRIVGILPPDNKTQDEGNRNRVFLAEELGFELMNYNDGFPCAFTGEKLTGPAPLCRALLLVPSNKVQPAAPAATAPAPVAEEEAPGSNAEVEAFFAATDEDAAASEEEEEEEHAAADETPAPRAVAVSASAMLAPAAPSAPAASAGVTAEQLLLHARQQAQELGWSYPVIMQENESGTTAADEPCALPEGSQLIAPRVSGVISWEHLSQVQNLLPAMQNYAGSDWKIYPWNEPLGLLHSALTTERKGELTAPWNAPELLATLSRMQQPGRCTIYTGTGEGGTPDFARATRTEVKRVGVIPPGTTGSLVSMEIVTVPGLPVRPPHYLCSPEDLSLLSLTCYKEFYWDYLSNDPQRAFYFSNRRFGFRCYAASIDDVQAVKDKLESMDFSVKSSAEDIAKNRKMDANLQRLLMLIGALAGTGAIIALVFNLFNATERRKKEYAILRTLGLGRLALLSLPVYETAIIMALTLVVSFGIYHGVNMLMAHYLADMVSEGGRLCYIPVEQQLLIAAVTMALAVLAALLSSLRLCRLSPAAYIRES